MFMIVMIGADDFLKIMTYHDNHENPRSIYDSIKITAPNNPLLLLFQVTPVAVW